MEVYECCYESISDWLREHTSYKLRNVVRNLVGLCMIVADAAIIYYAKDYKTLDYNRAILFWAAAVLIPVHVLKSHFLFLCLQKKTSGIIDEGKNITETIVATIDVIEFFLRFVVSLGLMLLNLFFGTLKVTMIYAALVALLCTRGKRMLEGDWLDFVFEDVALLAKRIFAKHQAKDNKE